jgi:hypothetical protein
MGGTSPVYTFSPTTPDAHTTVTLLDDFLSDFAGFALGNTRVTRDDTPIRFYFRRERSPDNSRYQIIMEVGYPTTDGTAANIGPFTLQLFDGAAPIHIPAPTLADQNATTTVAPFPSMGWFTRWRYNPRPYPEVRSTSSLLPGALNLVPSLSASMATLLRCVECGVGGGPFEANRYSSAYTTAFPSSVNPATDTNPVGVNENCGISTSTGGVGDRPELGIVNEWAANYIITGNTLARATMFTLAEVAGGMPWCIRDPVTDAPIDLVSTGNNFWLSGGGSIDTPTVVVPSGGGSGTWQLEINHLPNFSYVPYILTGDPYYLENQQFAAQWVVGVNGFHRYFGFQLNYADPASPAAANPFQTVPLLPSYRLAARGFGWAVRDWSQAYLVTPTFQLPSWLRSKSYCQSVLDQNQAYASNNSGSPDGTGANHDFVVSNYPALVTFGTAPAARSFEQGFFVSFFLMGVGFAINQALLTNWQVFYDYACRLPIGWANGTSGWPQNWPSPYTVQIQVFSTDYNGNPSPVTDFASLWDFYWRNTTEETIYWGTAGDPGFSSNFVGWTPSTAKLCNSWILEVRQGQPVPPNPGDVVSFTITGSFAGSPVTVSHTVTSGDVATLNATPFGSHSVSDGWRNPVVTDLINKINASAAATHGIIADLFNQATVGFEFNSTSIGRIYLSFDSTVVGNIVCTGSYTFGGPNTNSSVFIQPNGQGVHNGVAGSNLFGRPLNYQCAASGTTGTGAGPTGQALQTPTVVDGTCRWCYVPESMSDPFITPSPVLPAPPRMAQVYTNAPDGGAPQFGYPVQGWCGMNFAVTAGIAGAAGAAANLRATVVDWLNNVDPGARSRFAFAIDSAALALVVTPIFNQIAASTPLGATVATLQGVWSNGAPFTGTYQFVAPNWNHGTVPSFDPAGIYAISGNHVIINPAGPGVGALGGTHQDYSVAAVQ